MFKKIQFILLVPFCLLAIVGNQVAQTRDTRTPEQKMADFRTWDRLDSGQISPEGFRNDKNPDIREKAREVAEKNARDADSRAQSQQQMGDFRTWDRLDSGQISPEGFLNDKNPAIREKAREVAERNAAARDAQAQSQQQMADFRTWDRLDSGQISPERFLNDKNPAIREKAREMVERRAAAERRGGILSPLGNPVMRLNYEGAYDARPQRQAAGGMILSRWERTLFLPSGDRIPLPWDALWSGNARVSVEQSVGRHLGYDVTIRTRGGEPLESRIIAFAQEYGPAAALEMGLAYAPVGRFGHAILTGGLELVRPTQISDGEAVQWNNVPSAFGGRAVVRIIREH